MFQDKSDQIRCKLLKNRIDTAIESLKRTSGKNGIPKGYYDPDVNFAINVLEGRMDEPLKLIPQPSELE